MSDQPETLAVKGAWPERESNGLCMKYFVLKPSGDDAYAIASRRAMQAYAKWIEDENPEMALELIRWAGDEHGKSIVRRGEASEP